MSTPLSARTGPSGVNVERWLMRRLRSPLILSGGVVTKPLLVVLTSVLLSLVATGPAVALTVDQCHHEPSVAALRDCVQHAAAQGAIADPGLTQSLLAKLDAAQAAIVRGQPVVAVSILEAFLAEVKAQSGKHIVQPHTDHLLTHARLVIEALDA